MAKPRNKPRPRNRRDTDPEAKRLRESASRAANWQRWGPYLAERQWGTVREDYSAEGDPWNHFSYDEARSRVYRWGEDGLLGVCDRECRLCFALALWNGHDSHLKQRLFGLTNQQGNHGEDVKEDYFYLDATPTYSYMKSLYKYPHAAFPYEQLVAENARRSRAEREFKLADTGVFDEQRYFDVFAEYAKAGPNDLLIRITVHNRGPQRAVLHLLPTLWFRNTWIWGCRHEGCTLKPRIEQADDRTLKADHDTLGRFTLAADGEGELLMTEHETNTIKLYGTPHYTRYATDGIDRRVVHGDRAAVKHGGVGTKAAWWHVLDLKAGEEREIRLRLFADEQKPRGDALGRSFEHTFEKRVAEADGFYDRLLGGGMSAEARQVARQSYAGLLFSRQFYHYIVEDWLSGDPHMPPPPPQRLRGRNTDWPHLYNRDVICMPDKWEYPWYAAWDLAFHMIPLARVDPADAKRQLLLLLREWYMHPNGQIPAYEFNFSDVNPPVHAWACWRVYKMTAPRGRRDRTFLASAFQKLLLNFTWWVNRKDPDGRHLFSGGFLGLDNIGVFDRSRPLPTGGRLTQADGTAWMAFYCGTMLSIALELAVDDPAYEDMASKFFEHFVAITDAMNHLGGSGLWDERDGFYYDELHVDGVTTPMRARSMVGLIPLCAVEIIEQAVIDRLPGFRKRMQWFLANREDLARHISFMRHGRGERYLLAIPSRERLERVLRYMLDETEFLSPGGIRSLSRVHLDKPYELAADGVVHCVRYASGESDTSAFGGNSNWRGPVWFPVNFLLIEALLRYHHYYGDDLTVECPTGSGQMMNLGQAARVIERRLASLFLPDAQGRRPAHGDDRRFTDDPHFRDLVLFHEFFDGDTGRGCGAAHQTGWTALVTRCLERLAQRPTR